MGVVAAVIDETGLSGTRDVDAALSGAGFETWTSGVDAAGSGCMGLVDAVLNADAGLGTGDVDAAPSDVGFETWMSGVNATDWGFGGPIVSSSLQNEIPMMQIRTMASYAS